MRVQKYGNPGNLQNELSYFCRPYQKLPEIMPFILKSNLSGKGLLGVWQITESAGALEASLLLREEEKVHVSSIRNELRKRQWLACRKMIREMTGDPSAGVVYSDAGEPLMHDRSRFVSISHSGDFAAVILSEHHRTGIDIEVMKERITRVADRFLSPEEKARISEPDRIEKLFAHWSAKESLFKLTGGIQHDLQHGFVLDPIDYLCSSSGHVTATINLEGKSYRQELTWMTLHGCMLVYALGLKKYDET